MEIKLIEILSKYGWQGTVLGLLIVLVWQFLKTKLGSRIWKKISLNIIKLFKDVKVTDVPTKSISESDISNHDIFNYIDFWMYSKVPTLQFSTEYRTVVFKRYLSIFLRCYKKDLSEFVASKNYQTMDQSELWRNLLNIVNKIVYDYERESEESGIPKIIILKMKTKNNDTIQLIIDLIEGVINSQFYEGEKNLLKMYSILNIILSILENTISSSESVCDSINGQLKGLWIMDGGNRKITES